MGGSDGLLERIGKITRFAEGDGLTTDLRGFHVAEFLAIFNVIIYSATVFYTQSVLIAAAVELSTR